MPYKNKIFSLKYFLFITGFWVFAFLFLDLIIISNVKHIYPILEKVDFKILYPTIGMSAIGLFFGLVNAVFELYIFPSRVKKIPFYLVLIFRTFFLFIWINITYFLFLFVFGKLLGIIVIYEELAEFYRYKGIFSVYIYVLAGSFFINLFIQMMKKMGGRVFLNNFLGKYSKPQEEERIFMFLDLKSSTSIAEKLGHKDYSSFIKDFFYDVSLPVENTKGEIYQYVGDEIVITWLKKHGLKNSQCINCFFLAEKSVMKQAKYYQKKYGIIPEFKAGMHIGTVVTTEVGYLKQEIVFHGDTVNTASRIQELCSRLGCRLLLSKALADVTGSEQYSFKDMGSHKLKGKKEETELMCVE